MRTSDVAVRATDLVKTYPGARGKPGVRALDGLGFEVAAGSVVALLGPNGAGKTTAVKVLTTLSLADAGHAEVAGIDVARHPGRVRQLIGLVAQQPTADPMATGRENLVLAGRIHGMPRAAARSRAAQLLDRFGLASAADRLAKTYSGGMARRLDVALGLVHHPQVLFLDEPTTGLDPEVRAGMWDEIDRLAAEERTTVLLTTHYLDEADRLADRVAIIDSGRVVTEGPPDELKNGLRGDTVQIELSSAAALPAALGALAPLPELREVSGDGPRIRARADNGARAVPTVLSALDHAGVAATSVSVARPTLDDVYLRHVGQSLKEAA
jgi:ABC-2 type transport system ATP-binding protein